LREKKYYLFGLLLNFPHIFELFQIYKPLIIMFTLRSFGRFHLIPSRILTSLLLMTGSFTCPSMRSTTVFQLEAQTVMHIY